MCCKNKCVFPILPPSPSLLLFPSPPPHKLEGQKVGWYLRIMVAEGEGGRQLASSAPICFSERGKENAEDVMPEWLTSQQKGRLKVKLVNILLISNHHTPVFYSLPPLYFFSVALFSEGMAGKGRKSWDFAEIRVVSSTSKRLSSAGSLPASSISHLYETRQLGQTGSQPHFSTRSFYSLY